jgi:hypothetical protein
MKNEKDKDCRQASKQGTSIPHFRSRIIPIHGQINVARKKVTFSFFRFFTPCLVLIEECLEARTPHHETDNSAI